MITLELNAHTADDMKCVEELRSMGFSDEYIQKIYDMAKKNEEDNDGKA